MSAAANRYRTRSAVWGTAGVMTLGILGAPAAGWAQSHEVTFARDVAPIFQRACQVCHRPGSIAPMSLLSYADARPWARSIKQKVMTRSMPPWFIDRSVGIQRFKDDQGLTDDEIATIAAWVDAGAPQGDPTDMPAAVTFDTDIYAWTLQDELGREPDLVVPIPEPFTVPANSPNWWVEFVSDTGLTEDRWIKAYETKPSIEGFPVVHHATTTMFQDSAPEEQAFLSEYALGKTGDVHPDGTGRLIEAGTKLRWNMHYSANPAGEDATDRTSIALWLYPNGYEPKHPLVRRSVGSVTDLDLPPGASQVRTDGYTFLEDNVRLTVFQPHLHNLGKRQCLEAIYQDGRVQTLSCANWDFGWHIAYNYADDAQPLLPKGTVLHVISWHDNSTANRWAADPRNWVGWGNRSTDEMSFSHISWFTLSDEEYQEQLNTRLAARVTDN
ncbi:MAG: cytochrome c [Acidobacteriota bacterium]|nr:cytochrome c [Acidobacteriota bacterium]